jgi:hypothetical protein
VTDHDGAMLHWIKSDKGMILAITREDDAEFWYVINGISNDDNHLRDYVIGTIP